MRTHPNPVAVTMYDMAERFVGLAEFDGPDHDNPWILAWHSTCGLDPRVTHDEVPWCSAFLNGIAWQLRLPRSKSAAARSWLNVGVPVTLDEAVPGFDVVVLDRPPSPTAGHVFMYGSHDAETVTGVGGNQGDRVCVASFPRSRVIGLRRLR